MFSTGWKQTIHPWLLPVTSNEDLAKINECRLNANNLTLTKSKTEFMLIGSRQRLQTFNTPPSLFIDNAAIHQVVSTKSRAVYVDTNLSWNVHIDNIPYLFELAQDICHFSFHSRFSTPLTTINICGVMRSPLQIVVVVVAGVLVLSLLLLYYTKTDEHQENFLYDGATDEKQGQ